MGVYRDFPRWVRAIVTAGASLMAISIVTIAMNPVASSYEISFFQAYPIWFWGAVVATALLGQVLILVNVFDDSAEYWKAGLGLIVAVNTLLLVHPHIRYKLYGRGDVLTHIGEVRHIVGTGSLLEANYYPVTHILAALVTEFSALTPVKATSLLPAVFSLIYIGSFVYFAHYLSPDRVTFLLTLSFGTLLLFGSEHMYALPSALGFFLAPLVVYLYLKIHDRSQFRTYAVAFVFLAIILVPFHPLSFLYILAILLSLRGVHAVVPFSERFSLDVPGAIRSPVLLLGFVLHLWWYSSFASAVRTMTGILGPLLGRFEGGRFGHLTDVASTYSPSVIDVISIGVFSYGRLGLVVGVGGLLLSLYVLNRWQRNKPVSSSVAALSIVFFGFIALTAAAFFIDLLISYHRFARPIYFAAPFLIGIGLATQFKERNHRGRQVLTGVVICLLVVLLVLSVVNLHSSPVTKDNNKQVTEMEIAGADWYFENRDQSLLADGLGFKQFRFYGVTGEEYTRGDSFDDVIQLPEKNIRFGGTRPPDHFGYDDNSTLSDSYEDDRYLIVTELGRERYPELYPNYEPDWRFHPDDFEQLERDSAINRVYDNGEFDIYYVKT